TRRRLNRPSEWAERTVATVLAELVSARSTVLMRLLDVLGSITFQVGATVLVVLTPVLAVRTVVLPVASGLSTLLLHPPAPADGPASTWAYAPLAIGLITLALAVLGLATMTP